MSRHSKEFEQWAKTRELGKSRYVWMVGVLAWGLITGTMWAFGMAALNGWTTLPVVLPLAIIFFMSGGYLFGTFMWRASENWYAKEARTRVLPFGERAT